MFVYVFGSTRCRLSSRVWHLGLSGKDERHTGVVFRKILFYIPERAFGKPERDSRPALHNDGPMMSSVSDSEQPSETCVGGLCFIFLVYSHDSGKSRQSSDQVI